MTAIALLRETERETLKFRLLALLVVSVAVFFRVEEVPILGVVALVCAYLAYSVILRTFLIPAFTSYQLLAAMLLVDAATVLGAISLIGLDSPVIMLLPISVVYYGLYQGYIGSLTMSVVTSFGFVGLVFVSGRLTEMTNVVAIQVPSAFLLALLIGYLAQARFRETEEHRVLQQLVQTEAQGRRLLEIARSLRSELWASLDPDAVVRAAAEISGFRQVALIRVDDAPEGEAHIVAATYPPISPRSVPAIEVRDLIHDPLDADDADWVLNGRSVGLSYPKSWMPNDVVPEFLWAVRLSAAPSPLLCILGAARPAPPSADERRAMRAYAGLAGHVLDAYELSVHAERRSRNLIGELRSTVEGAKRLSQIQPLRPLQFGSLLIEPSRERVRLGATSVHLSKTEFDLLYVLASQPGNIYNADTLLREVWGPDHSAHGNQVDVAVHRLRKKLNAIPGGSGIVVTVRGRGYTFVTGVAAALGGNDPSGRSSVPPKSKAKTSSSSRRRSG